LGDKIGSLSVVLSLFCVQKILGLVLIPEQISLMPGKQNEKTPSLPTNHHWLWPAVCEARPTEGHGPDAGGSAFFDRMKNDGVLRKMHPYLSKTAQSPQVVGTAGKTAFFFGTFFWASKRKYRCRAKVTSPGGREHIFDCFNFNHNFFFTYWLFERDLVFRLRPGFFVLLF
jgi:hypothetical protein